MISFSDRRLPISLLVSKALLIVKALSDFTFGIKSAFDSKSAFRFHFWYQKRVLIVKALSDITFGCKSVRLEPLGGVRFLSLWVARLAA